MSMATAEQTLEEGVHEFPVTGLEVLFLFPTEADALREGSVAVAAFDGDDEQPLCEVRVTVGHRGIGDVVVWVWEAWDGLVSHRTFLSFYEAATIGQIAMINLARLEATRRANAALARRLTEEVG